MAPRRVKLGPRAGRATAEESPIHPFLKWAGGKRQLLPQLRRFVPPGFSAYTEAFLGSGALFFDLAGTGRLRDVPVTLCDTNADLIGTYRALARDPVAVIDALGALARTHRARGSDCFYEIRARFNAARLVPGAARTASGYSAELAAQLLYLNRTCYNGLFRLNARGEFNVPAGRYANPQICDERLLMRVSAALRQPHVFVIHDTFERFAETAEPGEFLYFDPPYAPVSATAHFRSYTAVGFSTADQRRLQQVIIQLARRGCWVLLSNSVAPQITALYDENVEARRAGLRAHRIHARRAINSDGASRGCVEEYMITNVVPADETFTK